MHSFDTEIAGRYGIIEAVLINYMAFWIRKNKANEVHAYEGRYWTYNSLKAFAELFPYLTSKQIRRALDKLVEEGVVVSGNFNGNSRNRTKWYSFTDVGMKLIGEDLREGESVQKGKCICPNGQMEASKRANAFAQMGKSMTFKNSEDNDNNTLNTPSSLKDEVDPRAIDNTTSLKINSKLREEVEPKANNSDSSYIYINNTNIPQDVYSFWNNNIFPISESIAEKLADMVEQLGEEAVRYGMEVAVERGRRNLPYVRTCAQNYLTEGGKRGAYRSPPNSRGEAKDDMQRSYEKLMEKYAGGMPRDE